MPTLRRFNDVPRSLFLILMLFLVGCSGQSAPESSSTRIVYGLTLSPSGFDPHINQSSEMGIVLRQVYDTLVYRDPETGQFVPGLASAWTISGDQTVYTFTLRQGVKFHDGTPFNAQAVIANLNRIVAPETRSQNAAALLGTYTGYALIDDYTLEIRLSEPYAPLLDSLSQFYLGMASPTALETYGVERYQFNQVGTGSYRFVEYIPDDRLVIRRNPEYTWGPSFYQAPATGAIDEIEFRFYRDPVTRLAALEQGTAQVMGEIPPADARTLVGNSAFQIITAVVPGQPDQFLLNSQLAPTNNQTFRQALMLGANRTAIVDALYQGFSTPAEGILTRGTQFYSDTGVDRYPFNAQQARALLSTLGYTDTNADGLWDTPEGDLTLTMLVPPWGEYRQISQFLQDQWRAIGITLNLISLPDFSTLMSEIAKGEYHLVALNSYGVDPAFLKTYYTSDGSRNFSGYSSPELDSVLNDAALQLDPTIRAALYAQIQANIIEQAVVMPLRDRVNLNGVSAKISGLKYDAYGWYPILYNASYTP